ncbi:MAG: hypothetical protein CL459_03300 [Acidimicrobiaceae bacterium]|nr:hypothetical protein [Acidimicrobiaceae bacterium]
MHDVPPAAERRHESDGERLWNESYYLDWFDPEGRGGGYVRLGLYPELGVSWFWCCLVEADGPTVFVVDQEAPLPREPGLEVRAPGLWADLVVEAPLDHFSVGVEAFGVAVDDPAEAYRSGPAGLLGDRIPVGLDLGWETDGPDTGDLWAFHYGVATRYEVPCRVAGEVLVGDRRIDLDGWGQRDHSWGVRDWWADGWTWCSGRLEDGERFHAVQVVGRGGGIGYRSSPDGLVPEYGVVSSPVLGPEGIPTAGTLELGDLCLEVEPVAWAPVLLTHPDDGRESRFPRGLVAVTAADGRRGHAWLELNQPS